MNSPERISMQSGTAFWTCWRQLSEHDEQLHTAPNSQSGVVHSLQVLLDWQVRQPSEQSVIVSEQGIQAPRGAQDWSVKTEEGQIPSLLQSTISSGTHRSVSGWQLKPSMHLPCSQGRPFNSVEGRMHPAAKRKTAQTRADQLRTER